ncbi:Retrovirus-related Pol polyprotein from transposon 412 [Vitis vinifera]|uniref:Retrovirus-related Pol polyprotein from transposon 412 n=1 Tax=Vitis vinifera TaxID=29760 RepID=A0A438FF22_VITVI|nr:Retrovirus-related Pol polyprotein from transposon 412 [Vitis vinifera]
MRNSMSVRRDTWRPSMLVLTMVLIHGYWRSGKTKSQPNAFNAKAGMYTLNEDIDMKAKVAAMTRRLEELELKKIHEVQAVAETPVQVKPCPICQSYEHLVEECPTIPAARKCLEIKQMSLDNSSPTTMLHMEILTTQIGGTIQISWKPRAPQYTQPAQASQQASNLEQAIVNLSKKIDNLQYSISRLTNLNTVQEKGDFLLNLTKTPRVSMKWKLMRENLHKVRDVKALITLRSGKKVELPTPKPHVERRRRRDREEGGNQRKEERYSEGKRTMIQQNASEILEVLEVKVNIPLLDMIKQVPTYAKFLKDLCTIKRGLNVNKKAFLTEQVSAIIQCKSPLKYKDPGCPTISVMIGGTVVEKALLDLGASVNLLPYSVYKQLGLGELKPTSITLSLADRSEWTHATHVWQHDIGAQYLLYVKKPITPEEEEGPEEVCIIDTLVEEHCNQKMQEKLNESLGDLEEGLPEPSDLLATLQECKKAIGWQISDLKGISPLVCTHHIYMEEEAKPIRQPQRRLNPHMQEVVRAEVLKLLQAGIIYPISDSPWVSPTQVVPKKSGITVVQNEKGEEVATRLTSGWRVCIDYRKLNAVTRKDHFPLPFIDQVLERVSGHPFYCFLDGYSGYFQIEIDVEDQEKTTFTCPFGTYAYRRMPFGLCNAPATFQRCMLSIFSDMVERIMEVFMDDITIYGSTFEECLVNLEAVLNRCIEKDLVLNWEKCHFMVHKELSLATSSPRKALKLIKQRRFIKDFSKLSKPLCELLAKDAKFVWDERCQRSFEQLKQFLTTAPIVRAPNWQLPLK